MYKNYIKPFFPAMGNKNPLKQRKTLQAVIQNLLQKTTNWPQINYNIFETICL